jgi:hypothetical protein
VLLPQPIDRVLRTIVVTPEMHRVHHSVEPGRYRSPATQTVPARSPLRVSRATFPSLASMRRGSI